MIPAETLAPPPMDGAASAVEPAAEAGPYVINLCSSSTPMALPRVDLPELSRFNFFVSRRFEEGRERFRLHMGFFATQAEAESWLGLVREVYPGAWAGEAPGKKLRARAVAAAEAQAARASGPQPSADAPAGSTAPPVDADARASRRATAAVPAKVAQPAVPTLQPPVRASTPQVAATPPVVTSPTATEAKARAGGLRTNTNTPAKPVRAVKTTVPPAGSNIKEVLADLDRPTDILSVAMSVPLPPAEPALSDAQALQCLENRGPVEVAKPAAFAVQLQWSVQPISTEKLPPLAIFSAYSLYCVEGSREGRKWFGLRLGFFNDPISAKQVAAYVRSEFVSAAVVPVSAEERERVSGKAGVIALREATQMQRQATQEFKLFDPQETESSQSKPTRAAERPKAPVRALRPASASKTAAAVTQVQARERRSPQTLEETLEILGANDLAIDEGRDSAIEGRTGAQPPRPERSAPFTRLLERLGERVRRN